MTVTWIAGISLLAFILALLLAPACEVKLTRRVVNPVLVAAALMVIALIFGNAASYSADEGLVGLLGVLSGILVGVGLFLAVLASARFALPECDSGQTGSNAKAQEKEGQAAATTGRQASRRGRRS